MSWDACDAELSEAEAITLTILSCLEGVRGLTLGSHQCTLGSRALTPRSHRRYVHTDVSVFPGWRC